jgi:hypothetical protein
VGGGPDVVDPSAHAFRAFYDLAAAEALWRWTSGPLTPVMPFSIVRMEVRGKAVF